MTKFFYYPETDFEDLRDTENYWLYRSKESDYHKGHGHGVIYGTVYCNNSGGGEGSGIKSEVGGNQYPCELIQYWR